MHPRKLLLNVLREFVLDTCMARLWRGYGEVVKFSYKGVSVKMSITLWAPRTTNRRSMATRKRAQRQQSTRPSRAGPEGADKDGQNGKRTARGSAMLVHGPLAAERHLLARPKTIAVAKGVSSSFCYYMLGPKAPATKLKVL